MSYGYAILFRHTDITGDEYTEIKKMRLFKSESERDNAENIEFSRRMNKKIRFGEVVKFETKDKYCPDNMDKKVDCDDIKRTLHLYDLYMGLVSHGIINSENPQTDVMKWIDRHFYQSVETYEKMLNDKTEKTNGQNE